MDLVESLNPEQRAAVLHTSGPVLILAGAGSGKTRVIAHRIAHIVSSGLAEPRGVLAVTFTNKAAEEMRLRVEALLGTDCRAMWISTFHALCARLLRREAPLVGLSRDFVIYDSNDQLTVMKQALRVAWASTTAWCSRARRCRASATPRTAWRGPRRSTSTWNPREQHFATLYASLHQGAGRRARAGLRRPAAEDGGALPDVAVRPRALRAAVPARDGGRVSGHEPPAVPADPGADGRPPQPVRGGRSRPVDLQVARRRPAQHPRLRAGLSRGRRSSSWNGTTGRRRSSWTRRRP